MDAAKGAQRHLILTLCAKKFKFRAVFNLIEGQTLKTETIGQYQDEKTGKIYTVLKRTKEIVHKPVSGKSQVLEDTHDFITSCDIDLNPLDNEFNAFELMQIDGIIKRVRT